MISKAQLKQEFLAIPHLKELNLSYNHLGILYETIFSPKFSFFKDGFSFSLESLQLVGCQLEDDFVSKGTFGKMCKGMPNLLDLDLSHNFFEATFKSIMDSLQDNCFSLHTLSMAACAFSLQPLQNMVVLKRSKDSGRGFLNFKRLDLANSL